MQGGNDSFATALFTLDFMHWWATNGCHAACFHTSTGENNGVFYPDAKGNYQIYPNGYGIKAFELGGHGNVVSLGVTNLDGLNLTVYAVANSNVLYVTVINKEIGISARNAAVTIAPAAEAAGNVAVMFLAAPNNNPEATSGITLGGASINNSGPGFGQWTSLSSFTNGQCVVTVPATSAAIVRISPINSPDILQQPTNEAIQTNGTATFSMAASGMARLSYNWFFNGTNLEGSTNSGLIITNVQLANAGTYDVVVSNSYSIRTCFKSGDFVELKPASLYESISRGRCEINIQTSSGKTAHIDLYQDIFNSPIIVFPAGSNVFICVYDYDVDFQLLRIDLNQPFQSSSRKDFVKTNVIESTCQIDRIESSNTANWAAAGGVLQRISAEEYKEEAAGIDLLLCSVQTDPRTLLNAIKNYGNQGIYGQTF